GEASRLPPLPYATLFRSAAEQHLVRRQADARNRIARRERGLLDLGEEIIRIAVEQHAADADQRIIGMRPGLCQVERIDAVGPGLDRKSTRLNSSHVKISY